MSQPSLQQQIRNQFNGQEALPPGDPRYVDFSAERFSTGLIRKMANHILDSSQDTCQLFWGHRGGGKTTELYRLQRTLTDHAQSFFVVFCESDHYLEINDTDVPDVLLAILGALADAMEQAKLPLRSGPITNFFKDLVELLQSSVDITFKKGLGVLGELSTQIKRSPTHRTQVRDYLRARIARFVDAVNAVIVEAKTTLQKNNYGGLVIIVDNLDRIMPSYGSVNLHKQIFLDGIPNLIGLQCHTIFTIPQAIMHSEQGIALNNNLEKPIRSLAMVPVWTREGRVHETGRAKLREALEKRVQAVGAALVPTMFDSEETVMQLCVASGGYMRSLINLTYGAIEEADTFPITGEVVQRAIRSARALYQRGLLPKQWDTLVQVARTGGRTDDESCLTLLNSLCILEYEDADGPWFDVHPLLKEAKEFKERSSLLTTTRANP